MSSPRITYAARQDATRETEMAVLASIYRLALNSAGRDAAGTTSTNGTSVRNTEEVSDVERSNRPLAVEATHRPRKGKHGRND